MAEEGTVVEEAQEQEAVVAAGAMTGEELAAVRELALRAHPDVVPELVGGGSLAEILASLEPARAAYRRIADAATEAVRQNGGKVATVPVVPAGDAPRFAVDVDRLPSAEKIRRGLADRNR